MREAMTTDAKISWQCLFSNVLYYGYLYYKICFSILEIGNSCASFGFGNKISGIFKWSALQINLVNLISLTTMDDKSVETLSNKIEFLSILVTFSPFPPKQCWFFYFFDCTDHSTYSTLNWGAGGIRELTLEANKIEQMLKYRKASFPKSVSTTFVAHCSFFMVPLTVSSSV